MKLFLNTQKVSVFGSTLFTKNIVGSFQKLFLLVAVLFISNLNAKALNYYTIADGDYNDCSIWIPSCPEANIGFGDSVFINHNIIGVKGLSIEGVLTIGTSGSYIADSGIKIEELGYLYNNGYLKIESDLHIDGNFINTDKAEVLEVHSDGNMCNSDTLILQPGETYRNHGGLIECCGVIITDIYEADENNSLPARITCQTICSHAGKEPIIEISGSQVPAQEALLNLEPDDSFMTSPGTDFCPPFLLPVEIISFTATIISGREVELNWSTASELNNDFFTIQRSVDAINWEYVGTTKGAGTTFERQDYSLMDQTATGKAVYYRLQQTDFDGEQKDYEIRSVDFNEWSESHDFIVYPNPANEKATISGASVSSTSEIQLFDLSGKNVTAIVQIERMQNGNFILNTLDLNPGMYLIRIGNDAKRFQKN